MAIAGRVLLECLLPLLGQDPTAPHPQSPSELPWKVVATPEAGLGVSPFDELQLVSLGDGTYVGSYRLIGDGTPFATRVVRSIDRGETWEVVARLEHLSDVNLIEHERVARAAALVDGDDLVVLFTFSIRGRP
jgi:hypothetical protein